jgi:hypothetical protein
MSQDDITPAHMPIALLRAAEEQIEKEEVAAAFVLLLMEDDTIWFDGCSYKRKDLLWALDRMKHIIMTEAENS